MIRDVPPPDIEHDIKLTWNGVTKTIYKNHPEFNSTVVAKKTKTKSKKPKARQGRKDRFSSIQE